MRDQKFAIPPAPFVNNEYHRSKSSIYGVRNKIRGAGEKRNKAHLLIPDVWF